MIISNCKLFRMENLGVAHRPTQQMVYKENEIMSGSCTFYSNTFLTKVLLKVGLIIKVLELAAYVKIRQ